MADRATRDVLIRLRRATEEEARRAFAAAKRALREAEEARTRAARLVSQSEAILRRAESKQPPALAAGRLAARESFVTSLRRAVDEARESHRGAARRLGEAELSYEKSRAGLETALHARATAEAHEAETRTTERRLRARREESASGDRWRKK